MIMKVLAMKAIVKSRATKAAAVKVFCAVKTASTAMATAAAMPGVGG
jgi:hypothetical protein